MTYTTKDGVPILIDLPEGEKKETHYSQPSLVRACQNNERVASILDHFVYAACKEIKEQGLPEGCKVVTVTRTHKQILAGLKGSKPSRKSLIRYLDLLNEWQMVCSESYQREFTIHLDTIQQALNNPLPPKIRARGNSPRLQEKGGQVTTLQPSENVDTLQPLEVQHLQEKVVMLQHKVDKLQRELCNVTTFCGQVTTLQRAFDALQSFVQARFSDAPIITSNILPLDTSNIHGDDALAHRDPHTDVEISTTDTTLTIVFDDEFLPNFSQVAGLPSVSTWLKQSNLSTPVVDNSGEGATHGFDTNLDHRMPASVPDTFHCSHPQQVSGYTHGVAPDQTGIGDTQQSHSSSIAFGDTTEPELTPSQQSNQGDPLALPEKSQQPPHNKTPEVNRLTTPNLAPYPKSVEHSSLPSGIEGQVPLQRGESLPAQGDDKTSTMIHNDTEKSRESYSQKTRSNEQGVPASSSLFPVSESETPAETGSLSVETLLDMAQAIEPSEPPEMPPVEMPWNAEKLVRITEAMRFSRGKRGKRFQTTVPAPTVSGKKSKSARQRQIDAAKRILAQGVTEEQYVRAYADRNDEWWNTEQGSLTVEDMAANTKNKVMRILAILEKLDTKLQKNGGQQNGRVISLPDRQAQQSEEEKQRRERNRLRTADELRDVDPWGPYSKKVHGGTR